MTPKISEFTKKISPNMSLCWSKFMILSQISILFGTNNYIIILSVTKSLVLVINIHIEQIYLQPKILTVTCRFRMEHDGTILQQLNLIYTSCTHYGNEKDFLVLICKF